MEGVNFNFGGLASGLDTNAIINALVQVESIPILRLSGQRTQFNKQNAFFTNIDAKLDALQNAVRDLETPSQFSSFAATTSNDSAATASASGSASAGSYAINVTSLASTQSNTTGGFADADTTNIGSGRFEITVGADTYQIDVGSGPNTLEDLRDAITNSGAPVSATIIDDGTGTDPFKLVLTADDSGTDGAFTVDVSQFSPAGSAFDFNSILQSGNDAQFTLNGLQVRRSSNSIDDLVEGLTLNLTGAGAADITVAADNGGIRSNVQKFIDAYNDVASLLDSQFQVDEEGQTTAPLFGDSSLRRIQSSLRSAVTNQVSDITSTFTSLSSIGIRTNSSGKLELDSDEFDAALSDDFAGVTALFTDATSGLADRIDDAVGDITDPAFGIIKTRKDGIVSRVRGIDDRISLLEDRLDSYEQRLINRFASFEQLISGYQAQAASLAFPS